MVDTAVVKIEANMRIRTRSRFLGLALSPAPALSICLSHCLARSHVTCVLQSFPLQACLNVGMPVWKQLGKNRRSNGVASCAMPCCASSLYDNSADTSTEDGDDDQFCTNPSSFRHAVVQVPQPQLANCCWCSDMLLLLLLPSKPATPAR